MQNPMPVVAVVDDDISVRESLASLIRSVGIEVRAFASAEELLAAPDPRNADCLILDVRLPGMSGIELHHQLVGHNWKVPVIFITAHGYDERSRSETCSAWTVARLTKPFGEDELLNAVEAALKWGKEPETT